MRPLSSPLSLAVFPPGHIVAPLTVENDTAIISRMQGKTPKAKKHAKRKKSSSGPPPESKSIEVQHPKQLEYVHDMMREIAQQQVTLMAVPKILEGSVETKGKYDGAMHSRLVSLKSIGLTDSHIAEAAGIAPATLSKWRDKYPMLRNQLEQAASLAIASAGTLLQAMMLGDDDRAFRAAKFFLESHAAEFRNQAKADLSADLSVLAATVRERIYGMPPKTIEVKVVEQEKPSLPILDASTPSSTPVESESIDSEFTEFELSPTT